MLRAFCEEASTGSQPFARIPHHRLTLAGHPCASGQEDVDSEGTAALLEAQHKVASIKLQFSNCAIFTQTSA